MGDSARSTRRKNQAKNSAPSHKPQPVAKPPNKAKEAQPDIRKNRALVVLLGGVALVAVCVAIYRATAPLRLDRALRSDSLLQLEAAAASDPYNPRSFYYLGLRWLQLGQSNLAAQSLRRAADLDADDEKSWLGTAIATTAAGDEPRGLGVAIAYSKHDPKNADAHFTIAQICDQQGSIERALDEAQAATRLDPRNSNAWRLVGKEEIALGNQPEAEKALRQAVAQDSRNWRDQVDLGNLLMLEKQPDAAVACFQAAARLAPSEALPLLLLGKALLTQAAGPAQTETARQDLLQSAQIQPNNADVNHLLGICEMRVGHWQDARQDLQQAQVLAPADRDIASDLTAVDAQLHNSGALAADQEQLSRLTAYENQKNSLLAALKAKPNDPQKMLSLARLSAANHDDLAATLYYRVILSRFPSLAGAASEAKAVQDRAVKELALPISTPEPTVLTPDNTPLPILLRDAAALLAQGNTDQAQTAYLSILGQDAAYAPAYFGLGQVMDATGGRDQAIAYYEKAVSTDPRLAAAQFALAADYNSVGLSDEAILHYRQGLALTPDDAKGWDSLGQVLSADTNIYDQAEVAYKKAVSLQPNNPVYLRDLADLQAKRGEMDPAEAQYRRAIALAPGDPLTQYHLAGFLIANRPAASALEEAGHLLQQASASKPDDPMITYWQGRLAVQQGDGKDAVTDLLNALPQLHAANAADAWYNLSRAYLLAGNTSLATAAQSRSDRQRKLTDYINAIVSQLGVTPNRPDLRLKLAQLYTQDGDLNPATAQYRAVLQGDPGNKTALAGLKKLQ